LISGRYWGSKKAKGGNSRTDAGLGRAMASLCNGQSIGRDGSRDVELLERQRGIVKVNYSGKGFKEKTVMLWKLFLFPMPLYFV
jgi:hypothetical protein